MVKALLGALLPPAGGAEDVVAYSVPAAIDGKESELNFHQEALGRLLREVGYKPVPINEGLSVIFSELQQENFTGIGISCGGGMCIDGGDEIVRVTEDGAFARAVRVTSPLADAQLVGASEAPYPLLVGRVGATDEVAVFAIRGL